MVEITIEPISGDLNIQVPSENGEGNGNPLHYSCLENPMDRGAWGATVHGVARVRYDLVTVVGKLNYPL